MSSSSRTLVAPLRGVVIPLSEVPDPVFAEGTMGPGVAIDPLDDTLYAPCDGEIIQCARTAHAMTLKSDDGMEWLLHIGLDTVSLQGEGFELQVGEGDRVAAGDPLCCFDADKLAQRATALITPLVLTAGEHWSVKLLAEPGTVIERGQALLTLEPKAGNTAHPAETSAADRCESIEARREVIIGSASGLHARPAARLRALAREHEVELLLETSSGQQGRAQSVSALLNLSVREGDRISVVARGHNAQAAVDAAAALLSEAEALPRASGEPVSVNAEAAAPGTLNGLPASPGIAIGALQQFAPALPTVAKTAADPAIERGKLHAALKAVTVELEAAYAGARRHGQTAEAEVFEAHQAWLDDPALLGTAEQRMESGRSAGQAWFEALEIEAEQLRATRNARLAERADDLRDLQRQVMMQLSEEAPADVKVTPGVILAARELTPSEFVAVAERISGLCLAAGGTTSHVAILARARVFLVLSPWAMRCSRCKVTACVWTLIKAFSSWRRHSSARKRYAKRNSASSTPPTSCRRKPLGPPSPGMASVFTLPPISALPTRPRRPFSQERMGSG